MPFSGCAMPSVMLSVPEPPAASIKALYVRPAARAGGLSWHPASMQASTTALEKEVRYVRSELPAVF